MDCVATGNVLFPNDRIFPNSSGGGEGVLLVIFGEGGAGVSGSILQTLSYFRQKICNVPVPFFRPGLLNLHPFFRPGF